MSELKVHEVLARAFAAEGVDTLFALMGDGNMYWATALARQHGARIIHARHEHSAVAMADGWARKTGRVGVATTTCGPGFTQIMTALTVAVRRGTPLIVFVGDTPTTDGYHVQGIDQRPLAEATGARFIALRTMDRLLEDVREAFYVAAYERRPVVLSVPMDLQSRTFEWLPDYRPSAELMPRPQRMAPDPQMIAEAVQLIAGASKPIILAGEGAVRSGAGAVLEKLGERTGALLATTLRAKGFFDRSPWAIGISGAFAGDLAREYLAAADVVIAVGASLSAYTTEQGYMFPNAKVIQIDAQPRGLWQGLRVADLHIRADAQSAATALLAELEKRSARGEGFRSTATKEAIAADRPDARQQPIDPGTIDPRNALLELDKVIPADWDVVVGVGHFFNFVMTHMRGRVPERWHITHDFGAIGQGLPTAIGVAVARGDGKSDPDRGRRQPAHARAGARGFATARHQAADLHAQRRRLQRRGAQAGAGWRRSRRGDLRTSRPCGHRQGLQPGWRNRRRRRQAQGPVCGTRAGRPLHRLGPARVGQGRVATVPPRLLGRDLRLSARAIPAAPCARCRAPARSACCDARSAPACTEPAAAGGARPGAACVWRPPRPARSTCRDWTSTAVLSASMVPRYMGARGRGICPDSQRMVSVWTAPRVFSVSSDCRAT